MKREIVRAEFLPFYEKLQRDAKKDGEHVIIMKGTAKNLMVCDYSGMPIEPEEDCLGISICADWKEYRRWEGQYMEFE